MPQKFRIGRSKVLKKIKITVTDTSRPSSPSSCSCRKRKAGHEEKSEDIFTSDYSFTPSIITNDLNMGDNSCGNCSTNNHTVYQKDCDSNNSDISNGDGF